MNKYLKSYIDNQIIREYAEKELSGYSLSINDLPDHEKENLIDTLAFNDPDFKEAILDYAQKLIDMRLEAVSYIDRYDEGFSPHHDSVTGEVSWILDRGAA